MTIVDLHTHSLASDGQYTPAELVAKAKRAGIKVLALTDHDTLGGLNEAIAEGERVGVRVVSGVELSAEPFKNFHLLGYSFQVKCSSILEFCTRMKQRRENRNHRIITFLKEHGIHIELEEVQELAGKSVIGRPHFAQVMLKHGFVETRREAFDRYLDTPEFLKIDTGKPHAEECIAAIKSSGGKASWAHPYQTGLTNEQIEQTLKALVSYGLDAIECYYPKYTPEQTEFYLSLAKKYNLHITGGSDFHGEKVKPDIALANWELDVDWLLG